MSNVEVILVGGSKDGLVTEGVHGLQAVHNIVLNDTFDGPEYIDRYEPTDLNDKDGHKVYVHTGRYNSEESKSYWEKLNPADVEELVTAAKREREEEERLAAEEAAKAEAEKTEEQSKEEEAKSEESSDAAPEEAKEESSEKPAEQTSE
jgi:hypothetical protein